MDVYDEVPTIVTIWLTIIPKIALLVLILEIYTQLNIYSSASLESVLISLQGYISNNQSVIGALPLLTSNENIHIAIDQQVSLKNIFLISSVLSLIVGTVVGLAQSKIKRLLAYSTISHIGFMLLALAINTEQSIDSFLFYLIQYIITNLNIFFILLAVSYICLNSNRVSIRAKQEFIKDRDINFIKDLKGLFYINPFLSSSLSLSLFSMAGIPPFVGFFSKQFVLYSALDSGYYFISFLGILVSVISASYYLKIIKILHLKPETNTGIFLSQSKICFALSEIKNINREDTTINYYNSAAKDSEQGYVYFSQFHSVIISILTLFILLFIFKPTLILNSTQVLSLTLFKL